MQSPTVEILKSATIPCGRVCHGSTRDSLKFTVFAKARFDIYSPAHTKSDGSSPTIQLCMEEENTALSVTCSSSNSSIVTLLLLIVTEQNTTFLLMCLFH